MLLPEAADRRLRLDHPRTLQRNLFKAAEGRTKAVGDRLNMLESNLDAVRTVLNRRGSGDFSADTLPEFRAMPTEESKAFGRFLRVGAQHMEPGEVKALHVSTDSAGGYLAPVEFVRELLKVVSEQSPMLRLVRTITTSAGEIEFPIQTGATAAFWTGELEARQPSPEPAWGMQTIAMGELACYVDISLRLLDDASFSIESMIAQDLGEAFAAAETQAIFTGDGLKNKPRGIMNNADVGFVNSGSATDITPDSLIDLQYSLPSAYGCNGIWMMNLSTLAEIRKLKDSSQRYLFSEGNSGLVPGTPGTLLGRPVEIDPNMPNVAAGSFPILYSDFRQAYWLLHKENAGLSLLRDPFSIHGSGQVRIWARMRSGGACVRPTALKKLRIAA